MNKKTFIPLHFLILTIFLGILFMFLQVFEYKTAPFSITDGIYGSLFFLLTGFHGLHVMIGIIFLIVCAKRMEKEHFTSKHHLGFEAAAYYWHFVDVVWLFLFISLYWWGS
jgi:heme/copper-type cytochrome/quinol oxidase subunit 3